MATMSPRTKSQKTRQDLEYDSDPDHDDSPMEGTPGGPVDNPPIKEDALPSTTNGDKADNTVDDLEDDNTQHVNESAPQYPMPEDVSTEDQGAPGQEHDHTEAHGESQEEESHAKTAPGRERWYPGG